MSKKRKREWNDAGIIMARVKKHERTSLSFVFHRSLAYFQVLLCEHLSSSSWLQRLPSHRNVELEKRKSKERREREGQETKKKKKKPR